MTFDIENSEEHFEKKNHTHLLNCWMMILDIENQDFHINISIY